MTVGSFIIHVADAVGGIVVLYAGTRQLAAHPMRVTTGVSYTRRRLAEHPAVLSRRDAVAVFAVPGMLGGDADRSAIRRQLGKAWPEIGIDIALQHLGAWQDMRV